MYQNAKAVSLLKSGNIAEARKLATTLNLDGDCAVTINDWTVTYENGVLTQSFSLVPNDSACFVTCCLAGMSEDDKMIASSWTSQDVTAKGSKEFNSLLFANYTIKGDLQVTSEVIGIISNGKTSNFFSFSGTFDV